MVVIGTFPKHVNNLGVNLFKPGANLNLKNEIYSLKEVLLYSSEA